MKRLFYHIGIVYPISMEANCFSICGIVWVNHNAILALFMLVIMPSSIIIFFFGSIKRYFDWDKKKLTPHKKYPLPLQSYKGIRTKRANPNAGFFLSVISAYAVGNIYIIILLLILLREVCLPYDRSIHVIDLNPIDVPIFIFFGLSSVFYVLWIKQSCFILRHGSPVFRSFRSVIMFC